MKTLKLIGIFFSLFSLANKAIGQEINHLLSLNKVLDTYYQTAIPYFDTLSREKYKLPDGSYNKLMAFTYIETGKSMCRFTAREVAKTISNKDSLYKNSKNFYKVVNSYYVKNVPDLPSKFYQQVVNKLEN
jgi:hypothetical protein